MNCPMCGAAMISWFTQGRTWFSCALCHDYEEQCRRTDAIEILRNCLSALTALRDAGREPAIAPDAGKEYA